MAELLNYWAPGRAKSDLLVTTIQNAGVLVDAYHKTFAGTGISIRYDGTSAGREKVREAIADALRAQFEPADVVFDDERNS
ncbi:hypothetical protein ACWGID_29350 [Kribbella sp. NPDC054772]